MGHTWAILTGQDTGAVGQDIGTGKYMVQSSSKDICAGKFRVVKISVQEHTEFP
jgi:hypothetical protein